jgi:hypothetical protein
MLHKIAWVGGVLLLANITLLNPSVNKSAVATPDHPIRPLSACPNRLEDLIPLMLRDLPSYANRVSQRAYQLDPNADIPGSLVLAGQPDYAPLTLNPGEKLPATETDTPQVFFTTLERQYVDGKLVRLQHHHWLFITQTETYGWQLVLLFSAIDTYSIQQLPIQRPLNQQFSDLQPPSSPQNQSQGVIAQAIRLWLRDCKAGSVAGAL